MRELSRPRPRNLTGRILHWFVSLMGTLLVAMVLGVVIEWLGMTLFWSEQGAGRSAGILRQDLSYLVAGSMHTKTLPGTFEWAGWISSSLYQGMVVWTGLDMVFATLGATSVLLSDYLQAAHNIIQIFLVRLAIAITALPLFFLFAGWGALEGAVRRDLRRFGGDIERIPDIIERPKAVLLDIEKGNRLVYVFESLDGDGRLGKLVFWVNWQEKRRGITNSFRTAGYVDYHNLRQEEYLLLAGDLRS